MPTRPISPALLAVFIAGLALTTEANHARGATGICLAGAVTVIRQGACALAGGTLPRLPWVAAAGGASTVSDLLERAKEIKFDIGTNKLAESSLAFLDELAAALMRDPAARLEIVVHVGASGDAKKDTNLSKKRAELVKRTLVEKGVGANQLVASGRGSEDPIAPNLTRSGRARNERVELHRASAVGSK